MASYSDYRDILVVLQTSNGRIVKPALETLTKARELADQLGCRVNALLLGDAAMEDLAQTAIHHGADAVTLAEHEQLTVGNVDAYFAATLPVVKEQKPEILLMSATPLGLDLAPRLGAALGTGALSDATKLDVDDTDRLLIAKRLTYDGSVEAAATIPKHRPQIATLRPGSVRVGFPDDSRYGRVEKAEVDVPKSALKVRLVSVEDAPPREIPLESAEIVVAAGAGVKDVALAEQLAKALGGAWGVTRPVVQAGKAAESRHIGATGRHVRPRIYVAAGVSGAFEHYLGIRGSEVVVGINPDKRAPLFRYANYGLVGDANELIPLIIEQLKKD